MIDELFASNRGLRIASKSFVKDKNLEYIVKLYIDDYFAKTGLSVKEITDNYNLFLKEYLKNCTIFRDNGLYPFQYRKIEHYDRTYYDIALLTSILVTKHRFNIINQLYSYDFSDKKDILLVGVGAGVELELILGVISSKSKITAYDMSISEYVTKRFSDSILLHEEKFSGNIESYDLIVAIELLEHLENPYAFIKDCHDSLNSRGSCIVTTATNMPQDDHLYNFVDLSLFEEKCKKIGFKSIINNEILHGSSFASLDSKNNYFILSK